MRKLIAVTLFSVTMFSTTVVSEPEAQAMMIEQVSRVSIAPCSGIEWRRGVEQRERLIRCAARHWKVPGGAERALEIARCESGHNLYPRAFLEGSAGVFQHQSRYWAARAAKYLSTPLWGIDTARISVWNAWANVVVAFKMAMDKDIGWGPWSCA